MKSIAGLLLLSLLNASYGQFTFGGGVGGGFAFPNFFDIGLSAAETFAQQFQNGIQNLRSAQQIIEREFGNAFTQFGRRLEQARETGMNVSQDFRQRLEQQLEESRGLALEANREFQVNLERQRSLIRDRIQQLGNNRGFFETLERNRYERELRDIEQRIRQLQEQEHRLREFRFDFLFGFGHRVNTTTNSTDIKTPQNRNETNIRDQNNGLNTTRNSTDIQTPQNRNESTIGGQNQTRNETSTTNTTLPQNQISSNTTDITNNNSQRNSTDIHSQPIIPANNTNTDANQPTINTSPVAPANQTNRASNTTNTTA